MHTPSLTLSVLIPTYGRKDLLWNSVRQICPQLHKGDEILVLDQNNPPLDFPEEFAGHAVKKHQLAVPSLTRARNKGIELASGNYLLFLDDDILVPEDLLETHRLAIKRHPGCILAGAVDQEDIPDIESPGWVDLETGEIRTQFDLKTESPLPFFSGGHVLLPRHSLPPPPFYCRHFKGTAQGEEIDFALRCLAEGTHIWGIPQARIFHLKAGKGGCRAEAFQRRFVLDHVFNESLFFARNGRLFKSISFLRRLRGFVEFHSRRPGFFRHSPLLILKLFCHLAAGFLVGMACRQGPHHRHRRLPASLLRADASTRDSDGRLSGRTRTEFKGN